MTRKLETILENLAFGESPRWHDGALYFSDIHANEVARLMPDGRRETIATFPGPVSGIGWLPDGRMLVVSMEDKRVLRCEGDGNFVVHADLSAIATGLANDMLVREDGVAFVGNFGFSLYPPEDPCPAVLARVDPDGTVHIAEEETYFPNGMVITADGKTLIVGESGAACLTAFDLAADGTLSNRREWAELPSGAVPDGICLDAEGLIWAASPYTSEVLRMREGGEVVERIPTGQLAAACMLGGEDRKTLYICTADSTDPAVCRSNRTARILATRVEVPGAGQA
ncbi:SMP-30/gluconolactonase/LRE family protein [Variovorax sp. AFSI2.2]|uniref:SMP-30/gluconolactonase/LRE family protein n=1 Tax=Variovorax sp. AFSI2.2 TaxID=3384160 RepID=UPI003EBB8C0F